MKKNSYILFLLVLVGVFLGTRIYHLPQTFDMFGDSARDLLELEEWRTTGKPPLLGPHTSALSFNQSAWYFYFLFPIYLLSGQSIYTSQIFIIVWYLGWLFAGWRWGEKYGLTKLSLLFVWSVIIFHPLLLAQTRTVWNPSLVLPLMIAALLIQLQWLKREATKKETGWWSLFILFSVGFSYSVIPTVGLMIGAALLTTPKKRLWVISSLMVALVIANIGTIGYELKYHFQLTKNLSNQQVLQTSTDYWDKVMRMGTFVSGIRL